MKYSKMEAPFSSESLDGFKALRIHGDHVGLGETVDSFSKSIDYIILNEIEHRRERFSERLGRLDVKEKKQKKERTYHEKSITQLNKTLTSFRKERKKLDKKKLVEADKILKDPVTFKKLRDKSIESLQDSFLEDTTDPDVAFEIVEVFKQVFDRIEPGKGADGILDFIEGEIMELKRIRSSEKNRGREHRSPLLWYKVVAIAAYLGVAIFFVILCIPASLSSVDAFIACLVYYVGISSAARAVIRGLVLWC